MIIIIVIITRVVAIVMSDMTCLVLVLVFNTDFQPRRSLPMMAWPNTIHANYKLT